MNNLNRQKRARFSQNIDVNQMRDNSNQSISRSFQEICMEDLRIKFCRLSLEQV